MRRALLAVLAGALAYVAIATLRLVLETGSAFGLSPTLIVHFAYPEWLHIVLGVVRSAQVTLPALLGGWLLGGSSQSGRIAVVVGLVIAFTGAVTQYALVCVGHNFKFHVGFLFLVLLPWAEASIPAAVAAYAGMRLRQR